MTKKNKKEVLDIEFEELDVDRDVDDSDFDDTSDLDEDGDEIKIDKNRI